MAFRQFNIDVLGIRNSPCFLSCVSYSNLSVSSLQAASADETTQHAFDVVSCLATGCCSTAAAISDWKLEKFRHMFESGVSLLGRNG